MNWSIDSDYIIAALALLLIGTLLGLWLQRWKDRAVRAAMILKEQATLESARREAEAILREAKLAANEQAIKTKAEAEASLEQERKEAAAVEARLNERELLLNRQLESLVQQESCLRAERQNQAQKIVEIESLRAQATKLLQERREQLAAVSKLSEPEIRTAYLKEIEQESLSDAARLSQHVLDEAKISAEEKARRILGLAIQRYAGSHSSEISTATVAISGDEMKGRIIGREGRNIRAFEAATGVTVMIDDTPGAVVLSGFDPVRRQIAREAMERLILDGRIHPARIEEVVTKVSQEMDEVILRTGEEAIIKVGLAPMNHELVKMLGGLHFRHSFSQNILQHSIEVAELAGLLAAEMGTDVAIAKRAGLLHDIGKAASHELEGAHATVGADFCKRYGEPDAVVNAVASHHDEASHNCLLGVIVSAADAISASRPGARSETILTYIKRVDELEKIGLGFPGVEKCFALQAGRELRVMVQPAQVGDAEAFILARNIARKIEDELQYPGQIRVTVVRETRCVEFAK